MQLRGFYISALNGKSGQKAIEQNCEGLSIWHSLYVFPSLTDRV